MATVFAVASFFESDLNTNIKRAYTLRYKLFANS